MIFDADGGEFTFWPAGVVVSGDDSVELVIGVDAVAGQSLRSGADGLDRASVLGRRHGTTDPFVDLDAMPIDLTPWAGTRVLFDIKIRASGGLTDLARVPLNLVSASGRAADWTG